MTLHATRDGQQVTVTTTYGPVRNEVTEDAGHVRSFHGHLGRLLDEAEAEVKAAQHGHAGHSHTGIHPHPGTANPAGEATEVTF
jgi:hypothetical protein